MSVTALALAQGSPSPAVPEPRPAAPLVRDLHLRLGERADVRGRLGANAAGRRVTLQHAPRSGRWRPLSRTTASADGRYRFHVPVRTTGALRIVVQPAGDVAAEAAVGAGGASASPARRVIIAGKLVVPRRGHDVHAGEAVHVRGTLLPRSRGRRVVVEGGANGRWRVVAHARTRANGHFDARLVAASTGTQRLRVRFAGDRRNAAARARAGTLQAFRPGLASWYDLYGGGLACGGTLGYDTLGVAHKTLPCGTKVTLRYGSREVTVRVVDRGPYVGGREWDLTGATARALGFEGVGTVWSTV